MKTRLVESSTRFFFILGPALVNKLFSKIDLDLFFRYENALKSRIVFSKVVFYGLQKSVGKSWF